MWNVKRKRKKKQNNDHTFILGIVKIRTPIFPPPKRAVALWVCTEFHAWVKNGKNTLNVRWDDWKSHFRSPPSSLISLHGPFMSHSVLPLLQEVRAEDVAEAAWGTCCILTNILHTVLFSYSSQSCPLGRYVTAVHPCLTSFHHSSSSDTNICRYSICKDKNLAVTKILWCPDFQKWQMAPQRNPKPLEREEILSYKGVCMAESPDVSKLVWTVLLDLLSLRMMMSK